MLVYRIAKEKYASRLTASGIAGRWNHDGQYVLYTAGSRSLATLEMVVHRSALLSGANYKMMIISIPDKNNMITTVSQDSLPSNWKSIAAYPLLQEIGNKWYKQSQSLLLKVPSVIVEQEYNYLINTLHSDFRKNINLKLIEEFGFDSRL